MRYLETTRVPIGDLSPFPGNARTHDEAALDESAEVNGQYRSVVARRLDSGLQLLAGHGTVDAFARRGDQDVRVEVIEADDTEARRIVLADNGTSRNAGYDEKLLLELIDQASKDGGLPGTGWDEAAYRELLGSIGAGSDYEGDPDDVDVEPPVVPVSQLGDVWLLGRHRLVCGDSTAAGAWSALLVNNERAELVWTDPPYGVAYVGKTADALTIENDQMDPAALRALLAGAFESAMRHCAHGAAWYVACADKGGCFEQFLAVLSGLGVYRHQLIWVKDRFVLGRGDYHFRHEPVLYGWHPGAARLRPVVDRTQDTVWEIPRPKRSEDHPTMKPVELVARALRNSSQPGDVVVDMFGGSGTTLVACELEGRTARLIELGPNYCDVIARRYQDLTGNQPILERTGQRWDFTATPACEAA